MEKENSKLKAKHVLTGLLIMALAWLLVVAMIIVAYYIFTYLF